MPPQKPKKRLVSKGEFAISITKELVFTGIGAFLIATGCMISFFSIIFAIDNAICGLAIDHELRDCSLVAVVSAIAAYAGFALCKKANKTDAINSIAPITRHNVARLSAKESLVRPSSAASIPQEHVLLRATVATDETPTNKLLRPHE